VLTNDAYEHAAALGGRLADGIERVVAGHGLEWQTHRLFNRSGYTHAPKLPINAIQARASFNAELYNLQRLYMANRGVWEAIDSAGPACGIQTTAEELGHASLETSRASCLRQRELAWPPRLAAENVARCQSTASLMSPDRCTFASPSTVDRP
jgi:glutamate-1-semialdehyde aminotransferase